MAMRIDQNSLTRERDERDFVWERRRQEIGLVWRVRKEDVMN